MSDYTPTTEEVRTGYSTATYDDAKAEIEFNRWLAGVKAQERKAERERIIGLLMANELDRTILTAIVDLIEGEEQ